MAEMALLVVADPGIGCLVVSEKVGQLLFYLSGVFSARPVASFSLIWQTDRRVGQSLSHCRRLFVVLFCKELV